MHGDVHRDVHGNVHGDVQGEVHRGDWIGLLNLSEYEALQQNTNSHGHQKCWVIVMEFDFADFQVQLQRPGEDRENT